MSDNADLLEINRGLVTAPAGCGKTHLISEAVRNHDDDKPILVLTHTNAGVAALRSRFQRADASPKSYRLSTLDGFAMRLVGLFPLRSGVDRDVLEISNPRADYPAIKRAARTVLEAGHLQEIIGASYSRLIVDEYQDCCSDQHGLVSVLADVVPTCILGDPMQSVFTWLGLPDWELEVCTDFPLAAELDTPWRWRNAGTEELGHWLLDVRSRLLNRESVSFIDSPDEVCWVNLDGEEDCYTCQLGAARVRSPHPNGSVLIIGNSRFPNQQQRFACNIPGAVTVESVDLRDLVQFSQVFDFESEDALNMLLDFSSKVMRNVGVADFKRRISSLERGTARRAASKAEESALQFKRTPSPDSAVNLLVEINRAAGVTAYRSAVLRTCIRALNSCACSVDVSFHDAVISAREYSRMKGRSLPGRAVGSTLLLKGLEADVSVILNAADHDSCSLYVAMTRGSHLLSVCSEDSEWNSY